MNKVMKFGVFILLISLGFYAGDINSSLLGVDLTSASQEIVSLFRIGFWALGLGVLISFEGVFVR
jgi:hypothetical protein